MQWPAIARDWIITNFVMFDAVCADIHGHVNTACNPHGISHWSANEESKVRVRYVRLLTFTGAPDSVINNSGLQQWSPTV